MKNTIFLSFAFLVTRLPARPFNMRLSRFWVKIDRREKHECKQTTFETGFEIVTREYCGRIDGVPFTARYVECITDSYSVYSSFKLGSLKIAKSAVLVKSIVDAKNSSYFFSAKDDLLQEIINAKKQYYREEWYRLSGKLLNR